MKTSGNTILLTGGGSGIGQALARRWHDAGNRVVVAGRRTDALEETAAGRPGIHVERLDVDDVDGLRANVAAILRRHPTINVLVNNAGIMRFERLDRARDLADAEATIATNLLGPIRLTDALVEHLSAQPEAAIVNVTSGLAFVPLMSTPTYSATKAAIHSYTVSLREALRGRIEVIELAPPGVQTDLTPGQSTRPGYQPLDDFADEVMALFARQPTPEEILVRNVQGFRHAERDGKFEDAFAMLSERARETLSTLP
ncbi:SDR family oxidoreductase [Sphingomonas sp. LHG3406-1]|uniref:SDR family oxidoreductase n=1 Tax=Sphingomonas sp. LHG3406-1 TaxID=2804617 RepID=UPI0026272D5D|nr:SDR family oxidoreductase [Sphingomonas sp. LHG3406-1]